MKTTNGWMRWISDNLAGDIPEEGRERTVALLAGMSSAYADYWGSKVSKCQLHFTEHELGSYLMNPATLRSSRKYSLAGKVDKVATIDGRMCVVDHKTTSVADIEDPASVFWRRTAVDTQAGFYNILLLSNDVPVERVVWDVVVKPRFRPKKLTKKELEGMDDPPEDGMESYENFAKRIDDAMTSDPHRYFQQRTMSFSRGQVMDVMADIWDVGQDMAAATRTDRHPKNPAACITYNSPCSYLGVCSGQDDFSSGKWCRSDSTHTELEDFDEEDVITNSRLKTFLLCRRKHKHRYMDKWRRVEEPQREALIFGTLWHKVMDFVWNELTEVNTDVNSKESCPAIGVGQPAEADCDGD